MTDDANIPDEVKEAMKSIAEKAYDAGHAAGAAGAQAEGDYFHFSGGSPGATKKIDTKHEAYMAEATPLISKLKAAGIRGMKNLRNHPEMRALEARHGR